MRIRLCELTISCKQATEHLELSAFNYFYGKMGAGKSTIVRLVDYCVGGTLDMTPALQMEFVSATLSLEIATNNVILTRIRDSSQIEASWQGPDGPLRVVVPAKAANGEVLPGTGVEVVSDLLFYIAGELAPKIRKNKVDEAAGLERLSFRDLLFFCYLDQETIDSSFYDLELGADVFRQRKSRYALKYVLGYHQGVLSELEMKLESARESKLRAEEGANALREALNASGLGSKEEIRRREAKLRLELEKVISQLTQGREAGKASEQHAVQTLRKRARTLTDDLAAIEEAIADVESTIANDKRHKNELITLSMKFRRAGDARAVLQQIEFSRCPRCTQQLAPARENCCRVCGQPEPSLGAAVQEEISADVASRISEIEDLIGRHTSQLGMMRRDLEQLLLEKRRVDLQLNEASSQYDSAFLSSLLQFEREKAALDQQLLDLERFKNLDIRLAQLETEALEAEKQASDIRKELAQLRGPAEKDTKNLNRLGEIFLDCLLRAKIPGFEGTDTVSIVGPSFLPVVTRESDDGAVVTSFSHLGSGGKKTLFKCCFAIAIHRLAVEIGASLPTFLMIDTAMKNISERENREQFEGFYSMLYQLSGSELKDTQFIIVDKEFFPPPPELGLSVNSRFMAPDNDSAPPLIKYYRGH